MDSTPVSDPENISTMKFLFAIVILFTALACVLAEPEPQLNYFYKSRAAVNGALGYPRAYGGYGGYRGYHGYGGYGGYYGGYNGYFRGKRSADAEPQEEVKSGPEADAWNGYYGYPSTYYGYNGYYGHPYGYGYRYHSFGKRSADAEPEAQTNYFYTPRRAAVGYPGYGYYSRYGGYNRGYYGGYRGYNWG